MGRGCPNPTCSGASKHWPSRRRGQTFGSVLLRRGTFKRRAGTPRDASNTAITRASARVRESTKYERVIGFADALPSIREKVEEHMALRGLPREKVLATVVHLLETTLIRVGNDDYAKENNSYGLTTLKNRHVAVEGNEVHFRFTGKSGKQWSLRVKDRRVAKIIRACQELPGQELLQYVDEEGHCQDVTSTDVNDYLKEITGTDITAKDFRTWAGTVLAAMALNELESFDSAAQAKCNLSLRNRKGICAAWQHTDDLPQMLRPSGSAQLLHGWQSGPRAQIEGRERASQRNGEFQARRGRCARAAAQLSRERGGWFPKAAATRSLIILAAVLAPFRPMISSFLSSSSSVAMKNFSSSC